MKWNGTKVNKYRNRKVECDGYNFDSIKEKDRYLELKLLEKAGTIRNLKLQPVFELQPKFSHRGIIHREIKYKADFRYDGITSDGFFREIVEDVKGWDRNKLKFFTTPLYKLKKKMLLFKYPDINFREV